MDATAVLLLLHVPPVIASVKVVEVPEQMLVVPVIVELLTEINFVVFVPQPVA